MEAMTDFISRFNTSINLDQKLVVKRRNRFFYVNETLKKSIKHNFFYVGAYLGKIKSRFFFPSFVLLTMIAETKANKIVVDKHTAWLFICGRDIFKRGIMQIMTEKGKGDYTLVLNQNKECLGFGKIICNIKEGKDRNRVIVRNVSNIGDFLKREKWL
jgi:ribosome biogenesis protein Nip4